MINMFIYIHLVVANVEAAKALKTPNSLTELYTYVSYMKDKSGINGWKEHNQLLQVQFFNQTISSYYELITDIVKNYIKNNIYLLQ